MNINAKQINYKDTAKRDNVKKTLLNILLYSALGLWALVVLFPFYWMIITAIKSNAAYLTETVPSFFPARPTLQNFATALTPSENVDLGLAFVNTFVFTVVTTALMMVVIVPAAFAFSRLNFRGKNLLFTFFLALMMIPAELVVITNFVTVTTVSAALPSKFAFFTKSLGLILPSVTSVFYIYLLKENFSQIPDELYWAAKVDGTRDFKYMMRVMLPICKPTVVTITILKVIECWNSYVWPRLILDKKESHLLSVAIQKLRESGAGRGNVPAMMAAVVLVSLPLIVLFLIFKDRIMEGVSRGGTKG